MDAPGIQTGGGGRLCRFRPETGRIWRRSGQKGARTRRGRGRYVIFGEKRPPLGGKWGKRGGTRGGGGRGRRGRLVSFPQKLPPFCHKWPQTAIQNTGGWAGMSIVLENGRWPRNVSETEIRHRAGYPRMRSPPPPPAPRHSRLCCRGLGRWLRARTGYGQARLGGVGATPIRSALVDRSTDRGHDATLRVATVRPPRMSLTAFAPLTAMRATRARPHYIAHSQI